MVTERNLTMKKATITLTELEIVNAIHQQNIFESPTGGDDLRFLLLDKYRKAKRYNQLVSSKECYDNSYKGLKTLFNLCGYSVEWEETGRGESEVMDIGKPIETYYLLLGKMTVKKDDFSFEMRTSRELNTSFSVDEVSPITAEIITYPTVITHEQIKERQATKNLYTLFDEVFCECGDMGVFRKDKYVYKVYPPERKEEAHEYVNRPSEEQILKDFSPMPYFPRYLGGVKDEYVIMTYLEGDTLENYWEEQHWDEQKEVPDWVLHQVEVALKFILREGYYPAEFEPRHILIDETKGYIYVIDVTAYRYLTDEEKQNKEDIFSEFMAPFYEN